MSDSRESLHEPLHQPPNPADLRRAPPTSPACARVRGWLRDFVDRDLQAAQVGEVEEHVHRCRVCAVELARAEHEAMRLRRLFAGGAGAPLLPASFASRVVDRLVLDETSLVSRELLAKVAASAVQAPARAGTAGARPRWGPAVWLASALLLVVALGVGLELVDTFGGAPRHEARLVVVSADHAYDLSGRLRAGSGLGDQQWLWVGAGGGARLDWHDPTDQPQPAATLQVHGLGQVRMDDGAPVLLSGTADVVTNRPVAIPLADGSQLELGVGEYTIAAEARSPDHLPPGEDPLAAMPHGLLVSVEVQSGQPATIVRTIDGSTLVAAGEIGIYRGNGPVDVGPSGNPAGGPLANTLPSPREPAVGDVVAPSALVGHLFDRSGVPALGAEVLLSVGVGGSLQYAARVAGIDGSFTVPTPGPVSTNFAITLATPPPARSELGLLAPDAVALVRQGSHTRLAAPMVFDLATPVYAVIRDELGLPRGGVTVVPCIVDELFGCVLPLSGERAVTGPDGSFRINRLPTRLPAHESLVLAILQEGLAPAMVAVPVRGSNAAQIAWPTITVRRLRLVRLHQLPENTAIEVLEELPLLPGGSSHWRRQAMTDAQGVVPSIAVGYERMWVRVGGSLVRELQPDAAVGLPRFRPFGPVRPYGSLFRGMLAVPSLAVDIVSSWRHQRTTDRGAEVTPTDGCLQVVDDSGQAVPGVHVFAVDASGPRGAADARFLGLSSSQGLVACPVDGEAALLAIAADGSTAMLAGSVASGNIMPMVLARPGRVLLAESRRPGSGEAQIVPMTFQRVNELLPGVMPVAVRFATAGNSWEVGDLAAGQYHVTIGESSFTVTVPTGGFAVLQ